MWDKFSAAEMARRWALARDLMRRYDLEALVIFGNSGANRHNQAQGFGVSKHPDLPPNYPVSPAAEPVEAAM